MNNELKEMIQEYNEIEADQNLRLRAIHAKIKAQKGQGIRSVLFSSGERWDACWKRDDVKQDHKLNIDCMDRSILTVNMFGEIYAAK